MGFDNDEYAALYRLYLDCDDGKAATIQQFQRELGLSYAVAKKVYEIYNPPRS